MVSAVAANSTLSRVQSIDRSTIEEQIDCVAIFRNESLFIDPNVTSIKRDMYAVTVPIIVVICILVMIVNGTVLFAARMIKSKDHPTLPLTFSLAASDLWTSVSIAFSLVYNSYLFFVFDVRTNACVSLAAEAVRTGGMITGSLHLLALAIIHFLTIRCPTTYQKIVTPKTNWCAILLVWLLPPTCLFAFFVSIPGQFFRSPYKPCHGYCVSLVPWVTLEFRLVIFFSFFSPFIAMSALYVMFLILFRRQERKFSRMTTSNSSNDILKTHRTSVQKSQRQELHKSRRTFTTTILIWLTFFIGWIPSCTMFVLNCQTCLLFPTETVSTVRTVFFMGAISNSFILCKSLVNPIVYAVRIPEIKAALQKQHGWCSNLLICRERPGQRLDAARKKDHELFSMDEETSSAAATNRTPKKEKSMIKTVGETSTERDHLLKRNSAVGENIDCEIIENPNVRGSMTIDGKI